MQGWRRIGTSTSPRQQQSSLWLATPQAVELLQVLAGLRSSTRGLLPCTVLNWRATRWPAPVIYKLLPNRFSCLIGSLCVPTAYFIYCLAPYAWFILLARVIVGMNAGVKLPLVSVYLSETAIREYHREMMIVKQECGGSAAEKSSKSSVESTENPLRDKLFAVFTLVASGSIIVLLGVSYLVTMMPGVDLYHWGGWFMISVSIPPILLLLFYFKEHKPYKRPSCGSLICIGAGVHHYPRSQAVEGGLLRGPSDESDGELELAPIHNGGGKYALLPDSDMGEMAGTENVTSSFQGGDSSEGSEDQRHIMTGTSNLISIAALCTMSCAIRA